MPVLMSKIWSSPQYRFRVPAAEDNDMRLKEVVIDVTNSAPSFNEPSRHLSYLLDQASRFLGGVKYPKILDVGAGKLRNTIYLLKNLPGSQLWAVEYQELREGSEQAQHMYNKAAQFGGRFKPVVFPCQFLKLTQQFDLAVVANVMGVMPIPAERLLLLQCCYTRLKNSAYLLWYSQHKEADYTPGGSRCNDTTRLGDGYHVGSGKFRAFYRDIGPDEADQLLLASGFKFVQSLPAGHNLARIYQKTPYNLFSKLLKTTEISKIFVAGQSIPLPTDAPLKEVEAGHSHSVIAPDPQSFSFEHLCAQSLASLKQGNKDATSFHRVCELIFRRVFEGRLRNFRVEQEIDEGTKRVDIVARNYDEVGFFHRVQSYYHIPSPNIFIECKNYEKDPSNPELDQLAGRMHTNTGMLGFLVYRSGKNRARIRQRCKAVVKKGQYIIDLDDNDLRTMLKLRSDGEGQQLDDFLEQRLDLLTLQPE